MVDFKDYTYKMDRTLEVLQEDFGLSLIHI